MSAQLQVRENHQKQEAIETQVNDNTGEIKDLHKRVDFEIFSVYQYRSTLKRFCVPSLPWSLPPPLSLPAVEMTLHKCFRNNVIYRSLIFSSSAG